MIGKLYGLREKREWSMRGEKERGEEGEGRERKKKREKGERRNISKSAIEFYQEFS